MVPVWIRAAFNIGWLLVVVDLLWRTIIVSDMLDVIVTLPIVPLILILSVYRTFSKDPWQAVATRWRVLLLPAIPLALVFQPYYQVAIISGAALLLWWIVPRLLASRHPWHSVGWSVLGALILMLTAVYGHERLNFVLTAAARQRLVDRVIDHEIAWSDGAVITEMSTLEAAFVVYTPIPDPAAFDYGTMLPLTVKADIYLDLAHFW